MNKMLRSVAKIGAAVFVAGVIAFAITAAPAASVHEAKQVQLTSKADRLGPALKRADCSSQGWPWFESKCQFDLRESNGQAHSVRVIALR